MWLPFCLTLSNPRLNSTFSNVLASTILNLFTTQLLFLVCLQIPVFHSLTRNPSLPDKAPIPPSSFVGVHQVFHLEYEPQGCLVRYRRIIRFLDLFRYKWLFSSCFLGSLSWNYVSMILEFHDAQVNSKCISRIQHEEASIIPKWWGLAKTAKRIDAYRPWRCKLKLKMLKC